MIAYSWVVGLLAASGVLVLFSGGCTPGPLGGAASADLPGGVRVVWHEGEDYVEAPTGLERVAGEKAPASGGRALWGSALAKEGNVVRYEVVVPEAMADARIIFRYARLHWRETMVPAKMSVELSKGDRRIAREATFGDTRGWGDKAKDWQLVTASVGDLPAGKWSVTLTSLAGGTDICLDGFFLAPADFKVAAEELASLIRLKVTSDGYVGFRSGSTAVEQTKTRSLAMAVRTFGKSAGPVKVRLARASGAASDLPLSETKAEEQPGAQSLFYAMGKLEDGAYRLEADCALPRARFEVPLVLVGEFLSTLDARLAKLEAFTADLAKSDSAGARRCRADLEHAIEYLKAGRDRMEKSAATAEGSNWKLHLAQEEGIRNPAPMAESMRRAMAQSEETMARLAAGKDPYAGRRGDLRRAYRSAASGQLQVYRACVPSSYEKAEKVPFILMLHGGGGDENYFPDMADGKIPEMAGRRGYLIACPKWHSRTNPNWVADAFQLIEVMRTDYPKIDAARIYVTGISMGGFGTYNLATERPELFAAACCVSGTGKPERAAALKDVPLLILQGGADGVVPPAGAEAVAARLKELGYAHKLHVFPTYGHDYHAEEYLKLTLDFFDQHRKQ